MNLIVAVDLNAKPVQLIDEVVAWAERLGATVHLRAASAVPGHRGEAGTGAEAHPLRIEYRQIIEAENEAIQSLLQRVPERMRGTAAILDGAVDQAIAEAGQAADLVVCATHGRQGLSRIVHGSTSEAILRASVHPILVLRFGGGEQGGSIVAVGARPGRVLVPIDATAPSLAAVHAVSRWFPNAEITVATALVQPNPLKALSTVTDHPHYQWALTTLAPLLASAGLERAPTVLLAPSGGVGGAIVEEAAGYDMVAMTTHHRRELPRMWWGSVAERVVRLAPVPVLVAPIAS